MFQFTFIQALFLLFILLPAGRFLRRFIYALFDMFDRGNPIDEAGNSLWATSQMLKSAFRTVGIGKMAFGKGGGGGGGSSPGPISGSPAQPAGTPDRLTGIGNERSLGNMGDMDIAAKAGKTPLTASGNNGSLTATGNDGSVSFGDGVSPLSELHGMETNSPKIYGYLPEHQTGQMQKDFNQPVQQGVQQGLENMTKQSLSATGTDGMAVWRTSGRENNLPVGKSSSVVARGSTSNGYTSGGRTSFSSVPTGGRTSFSTVGGSAVKSGTPSQSRRIISMGSAMGGKSVSSGTVLGGHINTNTAQRVSASGTSQRVSTYGTSGTSQYASASGTASSGAVKVASLPFKNNYQSPQSYMSSNIRSGSGVRRSNVIQFQKASSYSGYKTSGSSVLRTEGERTHITNTASRVNAPARQSQTIQSQRQQSQRHYAPSTGTSSMNVFNVTPSAQPISKSEGEQSQEKRIINYTMERDVNEE
ncbi:hypothetical protein [Caldalkalibacillus thermarum]|uniref:hypothetical protein n=1 Tax=Caldalkalibacillus thermarum TaxID=296745 RepID=UPI001663EC11|nr:hypothetical protein [Caldalkalibacillus thermarum]